MEYVIIEVPDMNDSMSRVVLSGAYCQIRFTYNDTMDYWTFGIYDDRNEPIAIGMKIVPNICLNMFGPGSKIPGAFMALTSLEWIGHDAFKDGDAKFIYIPADQ